MGENIQALIKLQRKKQEFRKSCLMEVDLMELEKGNGMRFRWTTQQNVVSLVPERKSLIKISDKLSENPVILSLTRTLFCFPLLLKACVLVFHSKILVAGGCTSDSARSF